VADSEDVDEDGSRSGRNYGVGRGRERQRGVEEGIVKVK
jgi:hypothetical protein